MANDTIKTVKVFGQTRSIGITSYSDLSNKPTINGTELSGTLSLNDLGVAASTDVINIEANPNETASESLTKLKVGNVIYSLPQGGGTASSVAWNDVTGKPTFANVATSGDYDDLLNKPTIPAAQVQSDWNAVTGMGVILNKPALFSGDYEDLTNKPTIPTVPTNVSAFTNDAGYLTQHQDISGKQDSSSLETDVAAAGFTKNAGTITGITMNGASKGTSGVVDLGTVITDISGKQDKIDSDHKLSYTLLTDTPTIPSLSGYATETYVNNKVASVYKYKGSVTDYAHLPSSDLTVGDVYNVEDTGDNYAWDGTDWDKLGGTIDLSGYALSSSLATVATSGSYTDLTNRPTIPNITANPSGAASTNLEKVTIDSTTYSVGKNVTLSSEVASNADTIKSIAIDGTSYNFPLGSITDVTVGGTSVVSSGVAVIPAIPAAQVQSDWNASSGMGAILNKPTLFSGNYNDLTNKPTIPADTGDLTNNAGYITSSALSGYALSSSLATVATSGSYNDLSGKPSIPTVSLSSTGTSTNEINYITLNGTEYKIAGSGSTSSIAWGDITGKPTFASVATSGSYNDLSNTPNIPDAVSGTNDGTNWTSLTIGSSTYNLGTGSGSSTVSWSDIQNKPTFATVATSGSYDDLNNKPSIPTIAANPAGSASTNLEKLTVGSTTYSVGKNVTLSTNPVANSDVLGSITIDGASYNFPDAKLVSKVIYSGESSGNLTISDDVTKGHIFLWYGKHEGNTGTAVVAFSVDQISPGGGTAIEIPAVFNGWYCPIIIWNNTSDIYVGAKWSYNNNDTMTTYLIQQVS